MSGILFDARQHTPQQGGGVAHPVGVFDAQIVNTCAKGAGPKAQDPNGIRFVVEFNTPAGKIEKGYNVRNNSEQAVTIAQQELAALCYSVGIFNISAPTLPDGNLNMPEVGKELRGSRLRIEVGFQIDKDTKQPTAYTEVKKVLDMHGNEPGKPAAAAPSPTPAANGGAAAGGWGAGQGAAQTNAPAPNSGGWQPGPTQQAPPAQPQGWQQGPANPNPPWGSQQK